jgi:pimeloyl-ACP methyl ester carboxylesterase
VNARLTGVLGCALAAGLAVAASVPGADGYRNPTPGRTLVVQVPGMHRAKVQRNIVYARAGGVRLRMDVYRPRRARGAIPAVLVPAPLAAGSGRRSGQRVGWAQLIAASGLAAVDFDVRSDNARRSPAAPASDAAAALAYVRAHGRALGIDSSRLCGLGLSTDTAPWLLWATMHEPVRSVRCNVVYYAQLDFAEPDLAAYSALQYVRRDAGGVTPMLIAKAGRAEDPNVNASIDRLAATAHAVHADVRVVTNASGRHGFDVRAPSARSRAIVRETIRFLRSRLSRPLRLREDCVAPAERPGAVQFFAADDTRLVGLALGSGKAGVVVSHESNGDICAWLQYARELAATGLRVLDIDLRGHGSSQSPSGGRANRYDLDVAAATEFLRRTGTPNVAVAGGSLGGVASVVGATLLDPAPAAVVSVSGPDSDGPLDGIRAVRRLHAPVLFTAADEDTTFSDAARRLYAEAASADKQLLIRPGGAHGILLLDADAGARAAVTAFLRDRLGA